MSDNRQKESNINLLVIIAVDFDSSLKKGVTELLSQYDEDKFFSKVYLICPYIRRDREISLTDRVQFREYGWGRKTFGKFMSPFHFIRLIFKILNIVRLNEISLIRATEPTLAGIIALIASKLSGVPYCVSIHADYDQRFKLDGASGAPTLLGSRLLIWPIEKIVLKHAIRIFPIRESLTPYLLDRGVSLDKIRIFPHGINLDIFHKPIDFNLRSYLGGVSEETKIIVFAGRLSPENYVDEILDIALLLSKYRTDFLILLIGGGQLQEQ